MFTFHSFEISREKLSVFIRKFFLVSINSAIRKKSVFLSVTWPKLNAHMI